MHLNSTDNEALMLALGSAIAQIDLVHDLAPGLSLEHLRRELVNAYLDVLAERLKPYDQMVEKERLERRHATAEQPPF
jgi:hypothetical protein